MHYSDLDSINGRIFNRTEVSLGEAELREVEACYRFLEDFEQGKVIYGINTGFGPMAQYRIGDADLNSLQYNIIRSHSCGAGETLPDICVRAAMLARLQTFLNAKSGVHPDVVRILADFLNNEIYPLVPRHGSVGASGDLVQLAHIALALIGESEVSFRGETVSAAEAMKACGITPLRLRIRDGLALTNGTAVMTGIGMVNLAQARRLLDWAVKASVMLNEVVESYDDFMAEPIPKYKRLFPGGPECRLKGAYLIKCVGYETDENGNVTEIAAEYDPNSRGGDPADGRKVKGATIHWVDAATAVDAQVRLYDNLFSDADPDGGNKNFLDCLNPASLEVLTGCKLEASLANAQPSDRFQFMRVGYFCADSRDSKPGALVFNRAVSLKDSFKPKK